uniref:PH domain-containing protein n=1 Tax=Poecilia latipinna TaxID=48699 RepID=A0A3B3TGZ8_9TELE
MQDGQRKLCGFLQKQAGPLRAWKRRWFSYEQNQNQLFYFRSPQDVAPLGQIRLSGATFTCPSDLLPAHCASKLGLHHPEDRK